VAGPTSETCNQRVHRNSSSACAATGRARSALTSNACLAAAIADRAVATHAAASMPERRLPVSWPLSSAGMPPSAAPPISAPAAVTAAAAAAVCAADSHSVASGNAGAAGWDDSDFKLAAAFRSSRPAHPARGSESDSSEGPPPAVFPLSALDVSVPLPSLRPPRRRPPPPSRPNSRSVQKGPNSPTVRRKWQRTAAPAIPVLRPGDAKGEWGGVRERVASLRGGREEVSGSGNVVGCADESFPVPCPNVAGGSQYRFASPLLTWTPVLAHGARSRECRPPVADGTPGTVEGRLYQ
jgi:hypothetical protein